MSRSKPFTEELRLRLAEALGRKPCPTCGHIPPQSVRGDAKKVGITSSTLWRFLAGKRPSADAINAIYGFLQRASQQPEGKK
jgi:hypothetical protein